MKGKTAKLIRQARAAIMAEDGKHFEHDGDQETDERKVVSDLMEVNGGAFAELKRRERAMPKNINVTNAVTDLIVRTKRRLKQKQDPDFRLKLKQALEILSA